MKIELKYALVFSFILIVYVFIEHLLGYNTTRHDIGQYSRLVGVIVPLLAVFFGIREKREKVFGGTMTISQGVKTGSVIVIIQTTLTTLFFTLYGNVINPEYLPTLLEFERSKMVASGATADQIATHLDQLRTMYSLPLQPIVQEVVGVAFGVLFAFVFSFFLRRKSPQSSER